MKKGELHRSGKEAMQPTLFQAIETLCGNSPLKDVLKAVNGARAAYYGWL